MEFSKELCRLANVFNTPYLHAKSAHSQGVISLSEENIPLALKFFQKALNLWGSLDMPYEAAYTKELKGHAYSKLNDVDNSGVELAGARWLYEQLNAKQDIERINRISKKNTRQEVYGLTLRELQVLRRVGSGKTNKTIAGELFISVRTVDRHMSNIFNKLGVSSRVEAITFAIKNQFLDTTSL